MISRLLLRYAAYCLIFIRHYFRRRRYLSLIAIVAAPMSPQPIAQLRHAITLLPAALIAAFIADIFLRAAAAYTPC